MHQVQKVYNDTMKEEVQRALVDRILNALEKHEIDLVEMKVIANYILDNLEPVKEHAQLLDFLKNLQKKWSIFATVEKQYEHASSQFTVHSSQAKEKIVIDRLASYLNKLN